MAGFLSSRWGRGGQIGARVLASLVGVWCFVFGFVVFCIGAGRVMGLSYEDAQTLGHLLAFLVFTAMFLWCYVAPELRRVWGVLLGGAGLMGLLGWCLLQWAGPY
ncbi:MAG: iron uptake protein [Lautropia sp.]|nr:iron uptake protein [Lautropia sp.]